MSDQKRKNSAPSNDRDRVRRPITSGNRRALVEPNEDDSVARTTAAMLGRPLSRPGTTTAVTARPKRKSSPQPSPPPSPRAPDDGDNHEPADDGTIADGGGTSPRSASDAGQAASAATTSATTSNTTAAKRARRAPVVQTIGSMTITSNKAQLQGEYIAASKDVEHLTKRNEELERNLIRQKDEYELQLHQLRDASKQQKEQHELSTHQLREDAKLAKEQYQLDIHQLRDDLRLMRDDLSESRKLVNTLQGSMLDSLKQLLDASNQERKSATDIAFNEAKRNQGVELMQTLMQGMRQASSNMRMLMPPNTTELAVIRENQSVLVDQSRQHVRNRYRGKRHTVPQQRQELSELTKTIAAATKVFQDAKQQQVLYGGDTTEEGRKLAVQIEELEVEGNVLVATKAEIENTLKETDPTLAAAAAAAVPLPNIATGAAVPHIASTTLPRANTVSSSSSAAAASNSQPRPLVSAFAGHHTH